MSPIVKGATVLEDQPNKFVVEALASELKPEWIDDALRESGKHSLRVRLLPAALTVWLVILLGLYRRISYVNLLEKLDGALWMLAHWSLEAVPSSTALTKARDRIGVEPLKKLFERSAREWATGTLGLQFHGWRTLALDGSTHKTPDSASNRNHFKKPGASRGQAAYPQMRSVALVDAGTRLVLEERHAPYSSCEIQLARELLKTLAAVALVLMDRHFLSYDLLWDLFQSGSAFLVRVPCNIKPRVIEHLGRGDALVEVQIPRSYRRSRPDMPRTWTLRMISYTPEGGSEEIRLFTTLLDAKKIKAGELAALYHERWEIETVLDEIKTHLCECATVNRAVVFRSQTPQRVEQEWYGMLIAYNAVRRTMARAASVADPKIPPLRLSFTAALERLREAVYEMLRLPARRLPARYQRMLEQIARARVPQRPGRKNPRAVKIKMSKYKLKPSKAA